MYKVESSTIDCLVGSHIQFENEEIREGETIYVNKELTLKVENVMKNANGVIVTSGEEFIKLKKL